MPVGPSPSFFQQLPPVRQWRTHIPPKPSHKLNLWSVMKNCIGRDLSKIPMPVRHNTGTHDRVLITESRHSTGTCTECWYTGTVLITTTVLVSGSIIQTTALCTGTSTVPCALLIQITAHCLTGTQYCYLFL